jgi:hypothetical protein
LNQGTSVPLALDDSNCSQGALLLAFQAALGDEATSSTVALPAAALTITVAVLRLKLAFWAGSSHGNRRQVYLIHGSRLIVSSETQPAQVLLLEFGFERLYTGRPSFQAVFFGFFLQCSIFLRMSGV